MGLPRRNSSVHHKHSHPRNTNMTLLPRPATFAQMTIVLWMIVASVSAMQSTQTFWLLRLDNGRELSKNRTPLADLCGRWDESHANYKSKRYQEFVYTIPGVAESDVPKFDSKFCLLMAPKYPRMLGY